VMQAQLAGAGGDLKAARGFLDAALKVSPDDADALMMKAEVEISENQRDAAQKLLERTIAAHPGLVAARVALVALAVKSAKLEDAKAQLAKLKELAPRDIRTA